MRNSPTRSPSAEERLVWDLPVRTMHWLLAIATFGAWLSHYDLDEYFTVHVFCGCTVLVLVVTRIVWGFTGTRHARFANFIQGPRAMLRYLRAIASSSGYVGHNPLGAAMVLLLLGLLLAQAVTGLLANDQIANAGPLFGYVSTVVSDRLSGIHRLLGNVILICVCMHTGAVLAYLLLKRENLIRPMLTGKKPAVLVPEHAAISGSLTARAALIAAAVTAVLLLLIYMAPKATLAF